jgi:multimeric flavodoxin WrbA
MKILAILGSPHKGSSYHAVKFLEKRMKRLGKVEFDYLFLKDANLKTCAGCLQCIQNGRNRCPHKDDLDSIINRMQSADGIMLSSPVYVLDVTGIMKNFIDRLAFSCHRPMFFKHGLALANTAAIGHGRVSKYLADVMGVVGFRTVVRVGILTTPTDMAKIPERSQKKLAKAALELYGNIRRNSRKPSLMSVVQFRVQRAVFTTPSAQKDMPCDYEHYKGLTGRYYADADVGFFKNAAAAAIAWVFVRLSNI